VSRYRLGLYSGSGDAARPPLFRTAERQHADSAVEENGGARTAAPPLSNVQPQAASP
jgi:hypothetical protein